MTTVDHNSICWAMGKDHYYCAIAIIEKQQAQIEELRRVVAELKNRVDVYQQRMAVAEDTVRILEPQVYGGPSK